MAAPIFQLSVAEKVLKEVVEPYQGWMMEGEALVFSMIRKANRRTIQFGQGGKWFKGAMNLTEFKGGGVSYHSGEGIRTPFAPTYANPMAYMKHHYISFDIEHMVMAHAGGGAGSWVSLKKEEMTLRTRFLIQELNRQTCGDGTGYVAKVGASPDQSSPEPVAIHLWYPAGMYMTNDRSFQIIYTDRDTTHSDEIILSADTGTGNTYSYDSGTISGSAEGDYIGVYGSCYDKSNANLAYGVPAAYELTGFRAAFDDADPLCTGESGFVGLQNIAVANYPQWTGIVIDETGNNPDDAILEEACLRRQQRPGVLKRPTKMLSNYGIYSKYSENSLNTRQFGPKDNTFRGGYTKFAFNNIEWWLSNDSTYGDIYFFGDDDVELVELMPPRWIPGNLSSGEILRFKPLSDGVACEAVYGAYCELWYPNRRALVRVKGLNQNTLQIT